MKTYEQRKQTVVEMLNKGLIELDTFGQLAVEQFSDEVIEKAVSRKWISEEIANNIKCL